MSAKPNRYARRWLLLCALGMFRTPNGRFLVDAKRVFRSRPNVWGLEPLMFEDAYWVRP